MGCSCECSNESFILNQNEITKMKSICQKEYFSYLNFIYKLKGYLNSSQLIGNISLGEISDNKLETNLNIKQEFYLIPSKWFEDWEKWIKNIIMKNEYNPFRTKFKYKNYKNKPKFFFQLMAEDVWKKIYKNNKYNFNEEFKTQSGIICNNLIILEYNSSTEDKNGIEIFFFEKDEDLFLTNLLFSFEKCDNEKSEFNNLLSLLKISPIKEILGNMYYDQSQSEFIEQKKKIIIYNKTRIVNEEIKIFRKNQYEIFLESHNKKDKNEEDSENQNNNEGIQERTIIKVNPMNYKAKVDNPKNESQSWSRASTVMNVNHQNQMKNNNASNNIRYKLKLQKQEDIFMEDLKDEEDLKEKNLNDKLLFNNKLKAASKKKKFINLEGYNIDPSELEITEIIENKINESLLISIIYCLFNISRLRVFIYNNKNIQINETGFFSLFSKIINYLYEKLCSSDNTIDLTKIKNIQPNLIHNCSEYNCQRLVEIIIKIHGKNFVTRIIYILHSDINKKFKNFIPEKINIDNNKDSEYIEFIKSISSSHNSIIFDLFFGIKKVTKVCNKCKRGLFTYKIINVFNISFNKIKQYFFNNEINRQKTKNNEKVILSIEECLEYLYKEKKEDNAIFQCSSCNKTTNYNKIKEVLKYPNNPIFYINYDEQEDFKINIKKNISLSNNEYELIGIIARMIDFNKLSKNYFSYCQDIKNKKWFSFIDDCISEFDFDKEKDNITNPIALFYQKI